jgi:hypothetical protein
VAKQQSSLAQKVIIGTSILLLGLSFYQIKTVLDQSQPIKHEMAIPWSVFTEGYKAVLEKEELHVGALPKVQEMVGKSIVIYGYIVPIEQRERHSHFLLSATDSSCPFCMPSGVGGLVSVTMDNAIKFQKQPVLLKGIFSISDGKDSGIVYSISDAEKIQ